ncbi:MAG: GAF domain-containing protein, partial [Chloroflexota bacterium]
MDFAAAWRVAAALVATPALADQLALLLEAAPRVAGGDSATIYLRDQSSGALRVLARYGYAPAGADTPRPGGVTERVFATGQPLVVNDARADARVNKAVLAAGVRSFVALPLMARQSPGGTPAALRPIGVLYVNAKRAHAFDAETVETLAGLAALAAVAIENGALLEAQRAAAERLAEALRAREQFASVASHELKTPLTPLKGYLQAMQRR